MLYLKFDKKNILLYAVTDRFWIGKQTFWEQVEEALKAGVTFLQLREKEMEECEFLKEAKQIKVLARKYNVPFVINDNVKIALESDADGVHVGQSDMRACEVRALIGAEKILGVSVQTVMQAKIAEREGADYLGVGAMFNTSTKTDAAEVSYRTLKEICATVSIPVVAIGGISANNVALLSGSGIAGIAVVSSLFGGNSIYEAGKKLKKEIEAVVYYE
ncbi:thiamine phosphate synthase [Sinanaerobacter sp. ZZT-01]|uniref:thiamine phosphate synthase n=1 Tax=Sinanaerobacter sp. ZZT-01 TaxID=3111540 RepID=UPI003A988017